MTKKKFEDRNFAPITYSLLAVLFLLCCTGMYFRTQEIHAEIDQAPKPSKCAQDYTDTLSIENVYAEIMRCEIQFSEIVLRQVIHETGWLESHNCQHRNNLFGMKGSRVTSDNPEGYKIYRTWQESVAAYRQWQIRNYGDSQQEYYEFLKDVGYAEDGDRYVRSLKSYNIVIVKR